MVATTSELRDKLLASYPDAVSVGGPFRMFWANGDWQAELGWLWVTEIVRTRSDWWPALGIAIQHAVTDGGDLARTALADLHMNREEANVLLAWTEPLARKYPQALSAYSGRRSLIDIVGELSVHWDATHDAGFSLTLHDSKGESPVKEHIRTAAEVEGVLVRCARSGIPCPPSDGPWSWLVREALRHPWLEEMLPSVCASLANGNEKQVRAMLDWFTDQHDLWRHVELFDRWTRTPPAWWDEPAKKRKPRGWTSSPRWSPLHATLGDVARAASTTAANQLASRPVLDLPRMA